MSLKYEPASEPLHISVKFTTRVDLLRSNFWGLVSRPEHVSTYDVEPLKQADAPWGMGHHGMGGSQGMAIPGEDLYIGIAINKLTTETRCEAPYRGTSLTRKRPPPRTSVGS